MNRTNNDDIKILSNIQIFNEIKKFEKELIKLNFKKVSGQPFKAHEIKTRKYYLAQLKITLTSRLNILEKKQTKNLEFLISN